MLRSSVPIDTHHEDELGFRIWRQHNSGMMVRPHTHPDIEVNYLFDGGFSYLHGCTITPIEAGRFTVLWEVCRIKLSSLVSWAKVFGSRFR